MSRYSTHIRQRRYVGAKPFMIYVESLTGSTYEMRVFPAETILEIKMQIQSNEGLPISEQHLLYNLKELKDDEVVGDCNIPEKATLKLILSMKVGPLCSRRMQPIDRTGWKEIKEIINESCKQSLAQGIPPGSKLTVFVFADGNRVHCLKVLEKEDGTFAPVTKAWREAEERELACRMISVGSSSSEDSDESLDDQALMDKFTRLEQELQGLSLRGRKKKKKKRRSSRGAGTSRDDQTRSDREERPRNTRDASNLSAESSAALRLAHRSLRNIRRHSRMDPGSSQSQETVICPQCSRLPGMQSGPSPSNGERRAPQNDDSNEDPGRAPRDSVVTDDVQEISFSSSSEDDLETELNSLAAAEAAAARENESRDVDPDFVNINCGESELENETELYDDKRLSRVERARLIFAKLANCSPITRVVTVVNGKEIEVDIQEFAGVRTPLTIRPKPLTDVEIKFPSWSTSWIKKEPPKEEEVSVPYEVREVKKRHKCLTCKKKLNITNMYVCRCEGIFCCIHRYPEVHVCLYNSKVETEKKGKDNGIKSSTLSSDSE